MTILIVPLIMDIPHFGDFVQDSGFGILGLRYLCEKVKVATRARGVFVVLCGNRFQMVPLSEA